MQKIRTYRKELVGLIIGVFLFVCIGLGLFFQFEKWTAQNEAADKLNKGVAEIELIRFTLSHADLETELDWKHDHEFAYQNNMYDVVDKVEGEDSTTLIVFLDDKETKVMRRMAKLQRYVLGLGDTSDSKESKPKRQLRNWQLFIDEDSGIELTGPRDLEKLSCPNEETFYLSQYISPAIPPPDFG